jgi:hypothetical protein
LVEYRGISEKRLQSEAAKIRKEKFLNLQLVLLEGVGIFKYESRSRTILPNWSNIFVFVVFFFFRFYLIK